MRTYSTEIPGLAVRGDSRRRYWQVIHEPSGLPIAPALLGNMIQGHIRVNEFPTRREAIDAAERVAKATPYIPWGGSVEEIRAAAVDGRTYPEHNATMIRAITGDDRHFQDQAWR